MIHYYVDVTGLSEDDRSRQIDNFKMFVFLSVKYVPIPDSAQRVLDVWWNYEKPLEETNVLLPGVPFRRA